MKWILKCVLHQVQPYWSFHGDQFNMKLLWNRKRNWSWHIGVYFITWEFGYCSCLEAEYLAIANLCFIRRVILNLAQFCCFVDIYNDFTLTFLIKISVPSNFLQLSFPSVKVVNFFDSISILKLRQKFKFFSLFSINLSSKIWIIQE